MESRYRRKGQVLVVVHRNILEPARIHYVRQAFHPAARLLGRDARAILKRQTIQ